MPIAKIINAILAVSQPAFYADPTHTGRSIPPVRTGRGRGWLFGLGIAGGAMLCAALGGQGMAGQPAQEIAWLRQLADNGDAGAQLQLGLAYRDGRYGLTPDAKTGRYWLTQAAGNGQDYAADVVGTAPAQHPADKRDQHSGKESFAAMATQLDSPTLKLIAGTWDLLTHYAMATQTADALLARAETRDPTAEFQLGMRYRDGAWSVSRDPVKAEYWLQRAAADGNRLAAQALSELHPS